MSDETMDEIICQNAVPSRFGLSKAILVMRKDAVCLKGDRCLVMMVSIQSYR